MSGILHLFADVANAVNGEFSTTMTLEDAENILRNGIEIYGVKQDISFLKPIILLHTEKLFKELNMYPVQTSKVMFTGGGGRTLKQLLKSRVPGCLFQTNNMYATAYGLKKVGETLWQE
jgi:plasmid segregation protein ParM